MNIDDYKPHVIENLQYKYAHTVLAEQDLDNLEWAKNFINNYRKKHNK